MLRITKLLYVIVALGCTVICSTHYTCAQAHRTTAQSAKQKNDKAVKAYTVAINEYINAVYKPGVSRPDTLFINKNVDMPDIKLPPSIQGIGIVILPGDRSFQTLRKRSSSVLLNIPSWLSGDKPELMIVTFKDLKPQHHCSIHLKYNAERTNFVLDSLVFDYPYGKSGVTHN